MDQILKNTLDLLAKELEAVMVSNIEQNKSKMSGDLINSIEYSSEQIQPGIYGIKRSMLKYGLFVDQGKGRKPGNTPPVTPIIEWLSLKSIPIPSGLTKEQFAYAIAASVKNKGTSPKPKPFIQPTINEVLNGKGKQILEKGFNDYILDQINKKIK